MMQAKYESKHQPNTATGNKWRRTGPIVCKAALLFRAARCLNKGLEKALEALNRAKLYYCLLTYSTMLTTFI